MGLSHRSILILALAGLARIAPAQEVASDNLPREAFSQDLTRPERGVYLTIFRSPATGLEFRAGHAAAYLGFYPTILGKDGKRSNVNFIRAGVTYYARERGVGPYVSPSILWSLDRGWRSGALTEAGVRGPLFRGLNGRLGAAVLTTLNREVRVNPTIGMDLKLGARR
jgi:hypothetical protein